MITLHVLNDVANDDGSKQKSNCVIFASLKSETMGKLMNRIPGSRLSISSLPGSALRTQRLDRRKYKFVWRPLFGLMIFVLVSSWRTVVYENCHNHMSRTATDVLV